MTLRSTSKQKARTKAQLAKKDRGKRVDSNQVKKNNNITVKQEDTRGTFNKFIFPTIKEKMMKPDSGEEGRS